jgi:hypothetical protein
MRGSKKAKTRKGKQKMMNQRNILRSALAVALSAVILLTGAEARAQLPSQPSLHGAWRVTRQGVNCQTGLVMSTFPAIMVFHQGGTYTGYGVPPGGDPAQGTEWGVWQRTAGNQTYSFRFVSNTYTANGVFDGRVEVTGAAQLTSADSFTYSSTIRFFNAGGTPLFTVCGKATGTRFQ